MAKSKKDIEEKISLWERLNTKSRLSVIDPLTFEVKNSFAFTPINFVVVGLFVLIVIVTLTWTIIAFTPLRQSIPGYPDLAEEEKMKRLEMENLKFLNELEQKQAILDQYNKPLMAILNDQEPPDPSLPMDSLLLLDTSQINQLNFEVSEKDSILRKKIEAGEKYGFNIQKNITTGNADNIAGVYFFSPLKGEVSGEVNVKEGHFGIDVKAPKNEAVKSTLDGTVIYAEWTPENGHVIHIQHAHNLVSVYKHNSALLKKQGDAVKSGEPIAIIGNSGTLSIGTHLHFELWYNGVPLDPKLFVNFE
ncbi:MAG: M23 family metallopeptidase [Flavobacteriales bacterium]|nr:M23 family metallopeptidase [Flavobacteriales bacterium]MCB9197987.1 M23 family metallopeptidase [Flavobacteriales bacterium]